MLLSELLISAGAIWGNILLYIEFIQCSFCTELKNYFAAVHGDPDAHNFNEVRFGPTAKVIPILERRHFGTLKDFWKTMKFDPMVIGAVFKIISDKNIFLFIIQSMLYDIPFIDKYFYIKTIKKIVPSADKGNLRFKKRPGGLRPQLVNRATKELTMGVGEIVGENIIF